MNTKEYTKMETISLEAKEILNDLFEKGHSPNDIKLAMEDGAYLSEAGISQEISEEVHFVVKWIKNE